MEIVFVTCVDSWVWEPQAVSGPYDLYVHVIDAGGKQVWQRDLLARPPDEGPGNDYLFLARYPVDVPAGRYEARQAVTILLRFISRVRSSHVA